MESWQLIFVFFIVLMIARIVPRIIRERKMKLQKNVISTDQPFFNQTKALEKNEAKKDTFGRETKPESKEMMVLGEIIRGYKTFGEIRKRTELDSEELNSILEDLEKQELMKVEQKQGLVGIKVELFPTEKGYRKYDS